MQERQDVDAGGPDSVSHAVCRDRWVSGLNQRIANPSYVNRRTEGSNPSLSATFPVQRFPRKPVSLLNIKGIASINSCELCGLIVPAAFLRFPWQEFVVPVLRRPGDAGEHVGEPGLGIDIVELGSADRGVYGSRGRSRRTAIGVGAGPRSRCSSPSTEGAAERRSVQAVFNRFRASRAPSTMVFSFALATGSDSGTSPQSGAA